jgi:microsomal epoxide hydrolase
MQFEVTPFRISLPEAKLQSINASLLNFPWDSLQVGEGWTLGTSAKFMRDLTAYWIERYEWRAQETSLNRFPQFRVCIDGLELHFYHVRAKELRKDRASRPLLLCHGWPGSVFEFLRLIEPLTNPVGFGGASDDAFDVVIPALPGFGFSGRPRAPLGPRAVATLFNTLMTDVLGYRSYLAQGGDWGAIIASWLGIDFPTHCRGIHLNMMVFARSEVADLLPEERTWLARFQALQVTEGGYSHLQGSRPQTLSIAMHQSPLGVAAWIVEKFALWSDLTRDSNGNPDLCSLYSYDDLLTNIMFYVGPDSFASSAWIYYAFRSDRDNVLFADGRRCETPTAVAAFPDPVFSPQPRVMAERSYRIFQWTDMSRGGHFAAMEAPDLLTEDIRQFARLIHLVDQSGQ